MSKVAKASRKSAKEKGSENTEINRADQIAAAIRELAEMKGIAVSESKGIIEFSLRKSRILKKKLAPFYQIGFGGRYFRV